ncbi:unnamed protein product [Lactuca virosa]|uniref:Uncharacterized protein n=1 Tax=Lactuca virosa TaxID=75947 RepID=A0AAU9MNC0_9ASTR|nr:unnamed protein product [Lactuca virosa]
MRSMGTAEKEENEGKREDLWGLARPKEEATKLWWPSVGADGSCRAENKGEELGRLWLIHLTEKRRKNNGDDLFFDWIRSTL